MGVPSGYLSLTGGKNWINQGTLTVGGDDYLYFGTGGGNNTLTNAAGAILNLSSSYATPLYYYGYYGGTATLNNAGTLNQTSPAAIRSRAASPSTTPARSTSTPARSPITLT